MKLYEFGSFDSAETSGIIQVSCLITMHQNTLDEELCNQLCGTALLLSTAIIYNY